MSVPVLNTSQDGRRKIWFIDELYFGEATDSELWRPNVGDAVLDMDVGMYRVIAVDNNGIPSLELINRFSYSSDFNQESTSLITSISQYNSNIKNRIYQYKDSFPYTLTVDGHYLCYGSEPSYAVFYQGTDTSNPAKIISEVYNSSGSLAGNEVPMESVVVNIKTVKWPVTFNTSKELEDGEVVTCVIFKANGGIHLIESFRIINNNTLRPSSLTTKSIVGIHLKSEMLDTNDKTLILNNVGVPIDTQLFTAVLEYDDSTLVPIAIDGTKTTLVGLANYDSSIVGNPTKLTLSYKPSPSEPYINGSGTINSPIITSSYRLANIATSSSYNLKVFVTSTWNATTSKFSFKYYVINMEGDLFVDVTDRVTTSWMSNGATASKDTLNLEMIILVSLNMGDVAPTAYPNYIHTQNIIIRNGNPTSESYATLLSYNQKSSTYGDNIRGVIRETAKTLDVSLATTTHGLTAGDKESWLNLMYVSLEPQYDNQVLTAPPTPTSFEVLYNGQTSGYISVNDWFSPIDMSMFTILPTTLNSVEIVWHRETAGGDTILAISPLYIGS
jgi:hypothetical protein